jgi:predicted lipid-binding transport protein (Tim44 family)
MWLYAAVDAWKTARLIRSGVTPDGAEDILVQRFSGNPKLWGIVLTILGSLFFLQAFFNIRGLMRGILPVLLIGLGVYLLRDYVFKSKENETNQASYGNQNGAPDFVGAIGKTSFQNDTYDSQPEYPTQTRVRSWKNR